MKSNGALSKAVRREMGIANPNGEGRSRKAQMQLAQERDLISRTALVAAGFRKADLSLAMQRVREGLHAHTIRSAYDSHIINGDGTTGGFRYSNPFVDHRTRQASADMIFGMIPGMKAPKDDSRNGDLVVEVVTVAADGSKTAVRVSA